MGTRHGLKPRITVSPQRIAPSPPGRRRPSTGITLLFIACVFLVVGGSAIILYTSVLQPGQFRAQAVDSAAAKATGTAQADVRSTANTEETAQIRDNAAAAATAQVLAFAHAATTAALQQHVYTQATSANPAFNDPLKQQDSNHWEEDSKAGGGCAFTNRAYHASMSQTGFFASCRELSSTFSNFVFQVQMTVLKGDRGGIIFRSANSNTNFYLFRVGQDGSYDLFLYVDTNGSNAKSLAQGFSSTIHKGLNVPNNIAVLARGSNLSFYVNQQYVTSVNDTTYKSGAIGVCADDQLNPTEVAFNNAEVWIL
jgi:hypothetical protein